MLKSVFTIVSKNYFAYAKTLSESLTISNPGLHLHILIVDKFDEQFSKEHQDYSINWVEDLEIKNFDHIAFKYDILELNTNVKPTYAKYLFRKYDRLIYLDPDIYVYQSLDNIYKLLDKHTIVLTPHTLTPIEDEFIPNETDFLKSGIYNLGFVALTKNNESLKILDWWELRCLTLGFNEQSQGLFVDQKWMDLLPGFTDKLHILRYDGVNVAYWNLHERQLTFIDGVYYVNDQKLIFYHFSGLPLQDLSLISKYQNRYSFKSRPDLKELFEDYYNKLLNNGHLKYLKRPYSFGFFSNGKPINNLTRKVLSEHSSFFVIKEPFNSINSHYNALFSSGLIKSEAKIYSILPNNSKKKEVAFKVIMFISWVIVKLFGPIKAEVLLKFLQNNLSIRKMSHLIKADSD